jgi:hypothetical protein
LVDLINSQDNKHDGITDAVPGAEHMDVANDKVIKYPEARNKDQYGVENPGPVIDGSPFLKLPGEQESLQQYVNI